MLRARHDLGRNLNTKVFVKVAMKQILNNQIVNHGMFDKHCSLGLDQIPWADFLRRRDVALKADMPLWR